MADAAEQLRTIWNMMSPVIEKQIQTTGRFDTFGATLKAGQLVEAVLPAVNKNTGEFLRAHLRTLAATGQYQAIGMASNVVASVPESKVPVSGILYQFDNATGVSQATFLPYTLGGLGNIEYGELHGQEGDHSIW